MRPAPAAAARRRALMGRSLARVSVRRPSQVRARAPTPAFQFLGLRARSPCMASARRAARPHPPHPRCNLGRGGRRPSPAGGRGWQGPPAVARSRRRRRSKFRPRRARERNLWQRQRVRRGAQRHHGSLAAAGLPGRRALEAGPTGRGALSRRRELARRRRRRMQRLARALALRAGARQRRRAGSLQQPLAREA